MVDNPSIRSAIVFGEIVNIPDVILPHPPVSVGTSSDITCLFLNNYRITNKKVM